MGDFTNKVSKEEFKKITEENGMRIWPRDDKALDFLYEIAKKDDAIDKYLEGLTKKQFWFADDRNAALKKANSLEKNAYKKGLFGVHDHTEYLAGSDVLDDQESIDKFYEKKYGKKRPLSETEIRREKAKKDNERRLEEAKKARELQERAEKNGKEFDKKYKISYATFMYKASDNCWESLRGNSRDERALTKLYYAAKSSMNPNLVQVLQDLMNTDVKNVKERNEMAAHINDVIKEAIKSNTVFGEDLNNLNDIIKNNTLSDKVSEKDFEKLLNERNQRRHKREVDAAFKANKDAFAKKMKGLGWYSMSTEELLGIYKIVLDTTVNGKSPLDPYMSIFYNSKVKKGTPGHDMNEITRQFISQIKNSKLDQNLKNRVVHSANMIIFRNKSIEQNDIRNLEDDTYKILKTNKNEGKKLFVEQLIANGWAEADKANLEKIFDGGFDLEKGFDDREGAFNVLGDAKVDQQDPLNSKLTIMKDFVKYLEPSNENGKRNCVSAANEVIKGCEKGLEDQKKAAYQQKFDDISKSIKEDKKVKKTLKDADFSNTARKNFNAAENSKLIQKLRREANELYNTIRAVDFNLLGKGSPEFRDMLRDLKALKDYADDYLTLDKKGNVPEPRIAEYFDLQKDCIDSVQKYVEHKQGDLQEAGRKESWWRSRHEQPRINASLDVLGKLKTSYAYGRNAIIENAREVHRPKLDELIKGHDKFKGMKEINYIEYLGSTCKTAAMIANTDPKLWSPRGGDDPESLTDFVYRIENYGKAFKYELSPSKVHYSDTIEHKTWNKVEKVFTGENHEGKQYKDREVLSVKQLKDVVKETNPEITFRKTKDKDPKAEADAAKEEVKALKQSMLSRKQAQIDKNKVKADKGAKKPYEGDGPKIKM